MDFHAIEGARVRILTLKNICVFLISSIKQANYFPDRTKPPGPKDTKNNKGAVLATFPSKSEHHYN